MSRKKTYVNSVTERMLDSENFHSSKDFALQKFHYDQKSKLNPRMRDTSLSEYLIETQKYSLTNKLRSAYRFANDANRYPYGLPKSHLSTSADGDIRNSLISYLTKKEGFPVSILSYTLNTKNLLHFAWLKIADNLKYQHSNNEIKALSIMKGSPCYLYGGHLIMTQGTHSNYVLDNNITQSGLSLSYGKCFDRMENLAANHSDVIIGDRDAVVLIYAYKLGDNVLYETIEVSLSDVNPEVVDDTPIENEIIQVTYMAETGAKLFTYAYKSGGILELDTSVIFSDSLGQYYPRIYLREDAINTNKLNKSSAKYKGTKNIIKKLGLDLDEVTDQVMKSIEGLNNNFKYVFMQLTVSINKEMDDPITGKYLFNYFNRLHAKGLPKADGTSAATFQKVSDKEYSQEVYYKQSTKKINTGVALNNKGIALKVGEHCIKYTGNKHVLMQQTNSTNHISITLDGLVMTHLFDGHLIKCSGDDEGLTIPLDYSVVKNMLPTEKELLVNKSFQITITTVVTIKKKWYQRGIFKVIIGVISIAINFIIPGAGLTFMALIQAVATSFLVGLAVGLAIKLAVSIAAAMGISPEILAALTFIAVLGYSIATGNIDYSKMVDGKAILKALMPSVDMYQKAITNDILSIKKQMEEFQEFAKSEWDKLKEAQAMLFTGMIPPTLEMLTTPLNNNVFLGETAEEFYTRAVGVDVTDLTVNMVDYFLDATTIVTNKIKPQREFNTNMGDELLIT